MSKRTTSHDPLSNQSMDLKKKKLSHQENIFSDDILYDILSFHKNDFPFIVMNCALVSKQWSNVILERLKVELSCGNDKKVNGQFLQNVETFHMNINVFVKSFECERFSLFKQLTKLDIAYELEDPDYLDHLREQDYEEYQKYLQFTHKIGKTGAKYIGDQLRQLTYLNIGNNDIGDEGAKHISQLKLLTFLDVYENRISNVGLVNFSNELQHLTHLNINSNYIFSDDAKLLIEMKQLTHLNIGDNSLQEEGAKWISEMKQLKYLNISRNLIRSEGMKYICELTNLTTLNVSQNSIKDKGIEKLPNLEKLTELNISYNNISNKGAKLINELKQLTFLDMDCNEGGDMKGFKITIALKN
ncbi:predicted protein [Naegleria gruberi]|uniref:Predicted protein n=1 Tax=Naegleria gruberi TaxID=5762 RepID=D2VR78_NAEGR|nr:uncharacterized protein NAEGRDRAFT_71490 [Naegleria gruberi]EFC40557.1 predicted protein [Naegleria gruberi]|eukprot:XP_002673301.1 predicted protein [Naegleria gruberi strain NEG-M]